MLKNLSGELLYEILRNYDANKLTNNNDKYSNSNEYLIGKHLEKALENKDSNFKYYFMCGITYELAPDNPVIVVHEIIYDKNGKEISRDKSDQIYGRTTIEEWKSRNNTDPTNRRPIEELEPVQSERSEKLLQCFEEYRNRLSDKEQEEFEKAIDSILKIMLFEAVKGNIVDKVRELVERKYADVNAEDSEGMTPLDIAERKGFTEIANILRAQKKRKNEALLHAIAQGDLSGVKKALESGADVNAKNNSGHAPIIDAAIKGHAEIVKTLYVEYGADINAIDEWGWTALRYVIQNDYNNLELIKTLLECKNIEVNVPDKNGLTPLHIAVNCDRKEASQLIIQHLVENKADKPGYLKGEYSTYWNECEEKLLKEPNSNFSTTSVKAEEQQRGKQ